MLVMKKNLLVSERFPYPVRVEAILELIDQFPMRKLEKMTRKGSNLRSHYNTLSLTLTMNNWVGFFIGYWVCFMCKWMLFEYFYSV